MIVSPVMIWTTGILACLVGIVPTGEQAAQELRKLHERAIAKHRQGDFEAADVLAKRALQMLNAKSAESLQFASSFEAPEPQSNPVDPTAQASGDPEHQRRIAELNAVIAKLNLELSKTRAEIANQKALNAQKALESPRAKSGSADAKQVDRPVKQKQRIRLRVQDPTKGSLPTGAGDRAPDRKDSGSAAESRPSVPRQVEINERILRLEREIQQTRTEALRGKKLQEQLRADYEKVKQDFQKERQRAEELRRANEELKNAAAPQRKRMESERGSQIQRDRRVERVPGDQDRARPPQEGQQRPNEEQAKHIKIAIDHLNLAGLHDVARQLINRLEGQPQAQVRRPDDEKSRDTISGFVRELVGDLANDAKNAVKQELRNARRDVEQAMRDVQKGLQDAHRVMESRTANQIDEQSILRRELNDLRREVEAIKQRLDTKGPPGPPRKKKKAKREEGDL